MISSPENEKVQIGRARAGEGPGLSEVRLVDGKGPTPIHARATIVEGSSFVRPPATLKSNNNPTVVAWLTERRNRPGHIG